MRENSQVLEYFFQIPLHKFGGVEGYAFLTVGKKSSLELLT